MAPGIPVLKGHVKGHVRVKAEEARKVPPGIQKIDQESTSGKKKQRRDTLLGLRKIGAPRVIGMLVAMVFALPGLDWSQPTDHAELFSGGMAVTIGEIEAGRRASAYDIVYNERYMNMCSTEGFVTALYQVLNVRQGGGLTLAPVCSSWVWVSRHSTKRSKAHPMGQEDAISVQTGNLMACRCAIILLIATARGLFWVLEQPQNSLFEHHPMIQKVLALIKTFRYSLKMGDYGGCSQKPTWLYSCREAISDLSKFKPPADSIPMAKGKKVDLVETYHDSKGQKRVKGNGNMKQSQTYPLPFGRAMARLRTQLASTCRKDAKRFLRDAKRSKPKYMSVTKDFKLWVKHGNLDPVFQYLTS